MINMVPLHSNLDLTRMDSLVLTALVVVSLALVVSPASTDSTALSVDSLTSLSNYLTDSVAVVRADSASLDRLEERTWTRRLESLSWRHAKELRRMSLFRRSLTVVLVPVVVSSRG